MKERLTGSACLSAQRWGLPALEHALCKESALANLVELNQMTSITKSIGKGFS